MLDLGSNSFHAVVADVEDGVVVPVARERDMLHLGRTVARHGHVPPGRLAGAVRSVARLASFARDHGATTLVVVATAATRDADNGAEVLDRLAAAAGTPVRLLSGEDEAALAYRGVRAHLDDDGRTVAVLDLGGGSLEVAVGEGPRARGVASVGLGVSRLSALVDDDPPSRRDLAALDAEIERALATEPMLADPPAAPVVAIGGTVRAMARVLVAGGRAAPTPVPGVVATDRTALVRLAGRLRSLDLTGRRAVEGMDPERADHLHVAATVLVAVLGRLGVDHVEVCPWGLREGVLLDAASLPTDGPASAAVPRGPADSRGG